MRGLRLSIIVSVAAGIVAISGALAAVGYNMPKVATQAYVSEHARSDTVRHEELLRYVAGVDLMVTQGAAESAELRAIRLEAEIKRQKKSG